jgi:predicted ABC-type ATPase
VATLTVIAGPNGSGKSTLTGTLEFQGCGRLLDPGSIARSLNPLNPSAVAIAAGRDVLKRTADYLNRGVSFAVETTLSSRGRVDPIRKAKSRGYEIHLVFIGLDSLERCITRVPNRQCRSSAAIGGYCQVL